MPDLYDSKISTVAATAAWEEYHFGDGPSHDVFLRQTKSILDSIAPAIHAKALRDAADDAEAFSKDRRKKILPRIALRVAANWLRARADGISNV